MWKCILSIYIDCILFVEISTDAGYAFVSVKAVYNELHQTLMSINEPDDLKWWRNHHGPGMPTDWPKIEVCEKSSNITIKEIDSLVAGPLSDMNIHIYGAI